MNEEMKRKRGAPRGNQNARKHGFYSRVVDETEKRQLRQAASVKGIDDEIDLLRVKLKSVVARDPENVRLISQAVVSLARLLRTRHFLGYNKEDSLKQAMENVIRDIVLSLGVNPHALFLREPGQPLFLRDLEKTGPSALHER